MRAWDDLEARLRRDADAVRRAAQPGPTWHHNIMARVTSSALVKPTPWTSRLPAQALLAVALVVVALVGVFLNAHYLAPTPAKHAPITTTPAPTPAASPVPLPAAGPLAPGTYSLANPYRGGNPALSCTNGCSGYRQIIFTLPAGWATSNGFVYKNLGQPNEVAFSVWTVDQVYADPCHWQQSALSPLDITNHSRGANGGLVKGPEDRGLATQALRGARPRPVTILTMKGVDGTGADWSPYALRIDLSVPASLDISTCDKGQFRSWTVWEVPNGANSHHVSGQLDSVYMVDVDRRALAIDASHVPATNGTDLAELNAIIASMIIDRG